MSERRRNRLTASLDETDDHVALDAVASKGDASFSRRQAIHRCVRENDGLPEPLLMRAGRVGEKGASGC